MTGPSLPHLPSALERHVHLRTHWRLRDLEIDVQGDRAVLRGRATTSFTRLLAHQAAQDYLPDFHIENAIVVKDPVEFLLGVPLS
jgi:hypothetical protein